MSQWLFVTADQVAAQPLAAYLWLLASEYENGDITADYDEIAFRFRFSRADLDAGAKPLNRVQFESHSFGLGLAAGLPI
jgi:hypothetical protein